MPGQNFTYGNTRLGLSTPVYVYPIITQHTRVRVSCHHSAHPCTCVLSSLSTPMYVCPVITQHTRVRVSCHHVHVLQCRVWSRPMKL